MNKINNLHDRIGVSEGLGAALGAAMPMQTHVEQSAGSGLRVWQVGALCRAVADALDARFNPVAVRGEISGFSRATSGHCYFSIKDESGQIRCAMFRRAASLLEFSPRDGELVELRGRLGVYEQRGDLQLVVESMRKAGQGALFEQFLQLKAKLEAEGLFDSQRKRSLPPLPRGIGVVSSLGAAALQDVLSALQRRVPHLPVLVAPAAVQGAGAAAEMVQALSNLHHYSTPGRWQAGGLAKNSAQNRAVDVILLVRGGGSLEDLWSFNSEALVRAMAASPVPIISGVGHETDFTLADFVADLRAPTPTAAAELACAERGIWAGALGLMQERLSDTVLSALDAHTQRLDAANARLGRPLALLAQERQRLLSCAHGLRHAAAVGLGRQSAAVQALGAALPRSSQAGLGLAQQRLARAQLRLGLLDPSLVLQRGYAWLQNDSGQAIGSVAQVRPGQNLSATLHDGRLGLQVLSPNLA